MKGFTAYDLWEAEKAYEDLRDRAGTYRGTNPKKFYERFVQAKQRLDYIRKTLEEER